MDAGYGVEAWKPDSTYFEDANRETFVVAQIETPEALDNLEEIGKVRGIDLLFIGPADLGCRLSAMGSSLTIDDVVDRVSSVARANGKAWGITAGSVEDIARFRKLGAQMVPWGGDFALVGVLTTCSQELDSVLAGE